MKIILTESQIQKLKLNEELLNELDASQHVIDRFNQRLTKPTLRVTLVYKEMIDGTRYRKREQHIGMYKMSDHEKNIIKDKINLIFKYDYKVTQPDTTFGVLLYRFNIVGNLQNVVYWDKDPDDEFENEYMVNKHLGNGTGELFFTGINRSDENSGEKGEYYANTLSLIIRNNVATTAYFGKYDHFNERKMSVGRCIKNVGELKNFADGESSVPDTIKKFLDTELTIDGDKTPPNDDNPPESGNGPTGGSPSTDTPPPTEDSSTDLSSTDAPSTDLPVVKPKRPRIPRP